MCKAHTHAAASRPRVAAGPPPHHHLRASNNAPTHLLAGGAGYCILCSNEVRGNQLDRRRLGPTNHGSTLLPPAFFNGIIFNLHPPLGLRDVLIGGMAIDPPCVYPCMLVDGPRVGSACQRTPGTPVASLIDVVCW